MRIGIVGAGQLAQMMAQAASRLHVETICLALSPDECAGQASVLQVVPAFEPVHARDFVDQVDIATIETENIPLDFAEYIATHIPLRPSTQALAIAQDRLFEKQLFAQVGLPPAPFCAIDTVSDIPAAIKQVGLPGILKTRRWGYDGKGQVRCETEADLVAGVKALSPAPMIYEGFIAFEREVSLIGVRSMTGEVGFYPLCENTHQDGILRVTRAPFLNEALTLSAQAHMRKIWDALDYVGVLAIEFFVKGSQLIGNEMAPRVHNSGHWTIEGAETSQFENHIRAITGMPLGSCAAHGFSVMFNCIGTLPSSQALAAIPHAFYHPYGKEERPLRKVGHVTVVCASEAEALETKDF